MHTIIDKMRITFVFILFLIPTVCAFGTFQRVAVRGRILCGRQPAGDVLLKLYDKDIDFDDLLDERRSNATGHFLLDGWTTEVTDIEPVLKIYHDCEDTWWCQRRVRLDIPKKYINRGERSDMEYDYANLKVLDVGVINLETYIYGEDRDCFHKR